MFPSGRSLDSTRGGSEDVVEPTSACKDMWSASSEMRLGLLRMMLSLSGIKSVSTKPASRIKKSSPLVKKILPLLSVLSSVGIRSSLGLYSGDIIRLVNTSTTEAVRS